MLTFQFDLLSKPVDPIEVLCLNLGQRYVFFLNVQKKSTLHSFHLKQRKGNETAKTTTSNYFYLNQIISQTLYSSTQEVARKTFLLKKLLFALLQSPCRYHKREFLQIGRSEPYPKS